MVPEWSRRQEIRNLQFHIKFKKNGGKTSRSRNMEDPEGRMHGFQEGG